MKYVINWDNGHACGTLAGEYEVFKDAEQAARDWKHEMIAIEPTHAGRRAVEEAYSWEVVEVEQESEPDSEELLKREAWE